MLRKSRMFGGALAGALLWLGGCTTVINSVTEDLAADLSTAILNSEDPDTVRQGAPAYLLLIDALLGEEPRNENLLLQAATLNGSYAGAFVDDPVRAQVLSRKAMYQAEKAICLGLKRACNLRQRPFPEFERWLAALGPKDVPMAYGLGTAWAGWLQAHSDDLGAIAELGRVTALMERVLVLAPTHDGGTVQLYMGVLESLKPALVGGKPEKARAHFERAIDISQGRNLMAKVFFAESYARAVFDRELHDRLLNEVIQAEAVARDLTLTNTLAQRQAQTLLETADDYF